MVNLIVNGQAFRIEEGRQQATVHLVSVNGDAVTVELLRQIGKDPSEFLVRLANGVFRRVVGKDGEHGTRVMQKGSQ